MNHIVLHGRLTDTPELKNTNSGTEVVNFKVAVNRAPDKDGNKIADFIPCVAFNQRAAFISKYFNKGDGILLDGSLQMRSYTNKDGNNRTIAEVICAHVEFAEKKRDGATGSSAAPVQTAADDDSELPF